MKNEAIPRRQNFNCHSRSRLDPPHLLLFPISRPTQPKKPGYAMPFGEVAVANVKKPPYAKSERGFCIVDLFINEHAGGFGIPANLIA